VEAWLDGALVGGLYGLSLGSAFFGESMFSREPDASKAAFIPFVWALAEAGCTLVDSQVYTDHVASLGGKSVRRDEYLAMLERALASPTIKGDWAAAFPSFPSSRPWLELCEGGVSEVSST
ncbi:MAG TPA: leucyl/phenylalanyl-tRNA--protein transferase, partial [Spirochaetales bacterium]|nr:leucyl/phenylalanyl-tRNA--protein transferase [Spirochaetales bacterium]